MTTNHMETLDEALIRTGRADVIVDFTNVTKKQAVNMFINIYSGERCIPYQPDKPGIENWTEEEIKRLAKEFGSKIHDQKFSLPCSSSTSRISGSSRGEPCRRWTRGWRILAVTERMTYHRRA